MKPKNNFLRVSLNPVHSLHFKVIFYWLAKRRTQILTSATSQMKMQSVLPSFVFPHFLLSFHWLRQQWASIFLTQIQGIVVTKTLEIDGSSLKFSEQKILKFAFLFVLLVLETLKDKNFGLFNCFCGNFLKAAGKTI